MLHNVKKCYIIKAWQENYFLLVIGETIMKNLISYVRKISYELHEGDNDKTPESFDDYHEALQNYHMSLHVRPILIRRTIQVSKIQIK